MSVGAGMFAGETGSRRSSIKQKHLDPTKRREQLTRPDERSMYSHDSKGAHVFMLLIFDSDSRSSHLAEVHTRTNLS